MDVPDMRDDEAVARWMDEYTSDAVDVREATNNLRRLCREVARKVASVAWGAGNTAGLCGDSTAALHDHHVSLALDDILGPATEGEV